MADIAQTLQAVGEIVRPEVQQNLQTAMWGMVGPTFWRGYAVISALGALLLARNILHTARHSSGLDALTISRLIWLGGMILGAFVRVNSACEPLSAAFLVTAGAFTSVLIATDWCSREGAFKAKVLAVIRDALYRPPRASQGMARKR